MTSVQPDLSGIRGKPSPQLEKAIELLREKAISANFPDVAAHLESLLNESDDVIRSHPGILARAEASTPSTNEAA